MTKFSYLDYKFWIKSDEKYHKNGYTYVIPCVHVPKQKPAAISQNCIVSDEWIKIKQTLEISMKIQHQVLNLEPKTKAKLIEIRNSSSDVYMNITLTTK